MINDSIKEKIATKIQQILDHYSKNEAKIWKIGTDFYKSWKSILLFAKDKFTVRPLDEKYIVIREIKQHFRKYRNRLINNKSYQLLLDNENITPTKRLNKIVAKSTIRQYLQCGIALGFINVSMDHQKPGIYFDDKTTYKILNVFWKCLNVDIDLLLTQQIIKMIINSYDKLYEWQKNIGYSIFLCLLAKWPWIYQFNINHRFRIIKTNRTKIECSNFSDLKNEKDLDWFVKYRNTYKSTIENLLHFYKNNFDELLLCLINKLYSSIKNIDNKEEYDCQSNINTNYNAGINNKVINENNVDYSGLEIEDLIQKLRQVVDNNKSKLKNNIINSRVVQHKEWTDFDNIKSQPISSLQACHIYSISDIKKDIENYGIQLYKKTIDYNEFLKQKSQAINDAINSENGLLLNSFQHQLFDKYFSFSPVDGLIEIKYDDLESHNNEIDAMLRFAFNEQDINKIKTIRIKDDILTDEMKKYLSKRSI